MVIFGIILATLLKFFHASLSVSGTQSYPPTLSSAEEKKYFEKMHSGDENAREKLILHNLRLVSHIVRKYYSSSKIQEDLVSIGTLGLIKAVDSFNSNNGTRFATYAAKCIQNAILS